MRLRLLLLVVLAALSCATAAAPARALELGVQDDPVFVSRTYGDPGLGYQRLAGLRTRWLRINVIWSDYVRSGWGPYDQAVYAARLRGVQVQMTISGTPSYDKRGDRRLSWSSPNPSRFAGFARSVAQRYKGRVSRYSLWNEPNLPRWLSPSRQAPLLYRRLVLAGYPAIKRVDGGAQVLVGELTSSHDPLGFLRRMASGLKADGFAYHPFEFYQRPGSGRSSRGFIGINSLPAVKRTLSDLARRRKLTTLRGGALPLYLTEFGYLTKGFYKMRESRRADWIVRAFRVARQQRVREMVYYELFQSPSGYLAGDKWDSGIVQLDGTPLPTYTALANAASRGFR